MHSIFRNQILQNCYKLLELQGPVLREQFLSIFFDKKLLKFASKGDFTQFLTGWWQQLHF